MSVRYDAKSGCVMAESLTALLKQQLLGMLHECADAEKLSELNKRKEWLLGSKQSVVDAVIAILSLELKQAELSAKLKGGDVSASLVKIGKDDARIIDAFLSNFAEHQRIKQSAQQKQENDAK